MITSTYEYEYANQALLPTARVCCPITDLYAATLRGGDDTGARRYAGGNGAALRLRSRQPCESRGQRASNAETPRPVPEEIRPHEVLPRQSRTVRVTTAKDLCHASIAGVLPDERANILLVLRIKTELQVPNCSYYTAVVLEFCAV